jgi:plasmid maintenance system antidote protein VapI
MGSSDPFDDARVARARGDRLKQAADARGFRKQLALAASIGVHESAITRWKDGGAITLPNALRLCSVLDISLDWLLLGRGSMDSHRVSVGETPLSMHETRLLRWFRTMAPPVGTAFLSYTLST